MKHIEFEWDKKKDNSNKKKHGISFEEAKTIFYDPNALLIHDPSHSDHEDRFIMLGVSRILRLLVVCHCYRKDDEIIRIISARKANKKEQKQYKEKLS
ncbi:MAG: BrnT family toxin [Elusimicrobia bacterium]|nr:BrnT family toxin [Candidatus Liberimonas magnetica]